MPVAPYLLRSAKPICRRSQVSKYALHGHTMFCRFFHHKALQLISLTPLPPVPEGGISPSHSPWNKIHTSNCSASAAPVPRCTVSDNRSAHNSQRRAQRQRPAWFTAVATRACRADSHLTSLGPVSSVIETGSIPSFTLASRMLTPGFGCFCEASIFLRPGSLWPVPLSGSSPEDFCGTLSVCGRQPVSPGRRTCTTLWRPEGA